MHAFSFHNPTRIEFGIDKEKKMGKFMAEFAVKKALIVYGSERIKQSGLFDDVAQSLRDAGIDFVALGGIKSNPVLSKVHQAIALAKSEQVDCVLSIGGGSCLDSAKAIAAGALYEGEVWDFFCGKKVARNLPIFDVITLAATGSEMNNGGVITNEQTQQKYPIYGADLFPKVSVINPKLQASISDDYLRYSAADVIAHSIEAYFTAAERPQIMDLLVEGNIKTVLRTTEILLKNPEDLAARGEFAWAATMALNGLTHLGISSFNFPNHMMGHAMSAICDTPHGASLSVVMPAWMRWWHDRHPAQFARFAREIFGKDSGMAGIDALQAWLQQIGAPTTLAQLQIEGETLQRVIDNAAQIAIDWKMDTIYTREVIAEILALAQ